MLDLDKDFAKMFIETSRKYTPYKFLVINKNGIIIAATEEERVGVFHEASFKMMREGKEIIVVRPDEVDKYLGVKPGIDMPISHNQEMVGAIGITGIANEVKPVILMAKMTIEAMLDYQVYKERTTQKNSEREMFYSLLLSDEISKREQLDTLALRLGYKANVIRIPILLTVSDHEERVLSIIHSCENYNTEDFSFIHKNREIVIFMHLRKNKEVLLKSYRNSLESFLLYICQRMANEGIQYEYYVGSFQNNLRNYNFAYKHCVWLLDNRKTHAFFYDHVEEYAKSQLPMLELHGMFQTLANLFDERSKKNYIETMTVLKQYNYNLSEASKSLFMHKNTLVFRLNKIRDFLNVNPLQCDADRALLDYLHYYMCTLNVDRKFFSSVTQNPLIEDEH